MSEESYTQTQTLFVGGERNTANAFQGIDTSSRLLVIILGVATLVTRSESVDCDKVSDLLQ